MIIYKMKFTSDTAAAALTATKYKKKVSTYTLMLYKTLIAETDKTSCTITMHAIITAKVVHFTKCAQSNYAF